MNVINLFLVDQLTWKHDILCYTTDFNRFLPFMDFRVISASAAEIHTIRSHQDKVREKELTHYVITFVF